MIMTTLRIAFIINLIFLYSCAPKQDMIEINVTNELSIARTSETIEIDYQYFKSLLDKYGNRGIVVRDGQSNAVLLSQFIDLDGDGKDDQLIFQADFGPKEKKHFHIEGTNEPVSPPESNKSTFARFVPERIDDFAWENDRVAFRTYGPTAQAITESGKPGGTLSSGIDCWLKRVEYPIIDKWYKQDLEEGLSYHQDHGEGLDNYHVGPSRGTGGIGIWQNGQLSISKNYQSWKIIANGPVRTIFELDYGTWDADGIPVKEIKRISIDLGSNLFKNTLLLGNHNELPNVTLGVSLHDKKGDVLAKKQEGWFRYLEPHFETELATAIVVDPSIIMEFIDYRVETVDLSNLLVVCKPAAEVSYYAGFTWSKSEQFELPGGFDQYLADFALRISSPLVVDIYH
jgi:hypothetical protein